MTLIVIDCEELELSGAPSRASSPLRIRCQMPATLCGCFPATARRAEEELLRTFANRTVCIVRSSMSVCIRELSGGWVGGPRQAAKGYTHPYLSIPLEGKVGIFRVVAVEKV